MKRFYWEQNEYERKSIINCLWDLGFTNVTFRPLYTIDNIDNSNEIRLKSQAELNAPLIFLRKSFFVDSNNLS